jgi:hypothetical protein
MNLSERIEAFAELGFILRSVAAGKNVKAARMLPGVMERQQSLNPWFTPENVRMAVKSIGLKLTEENLRVWTAMYPALSEKYVPLKIGVIMAGNIPLVGFHDFLSVLISGNELIARTSSKDSGLIVQIGEILASLHSGFGKVISFSDGTISGFDAVIATGSDNTSRYFESYFSRYPHIIRKNRNSVAVLTGDESDEDYQNLGKDIFTYFGLGCRSVSKLYVPEGFGFERMIRNLDSYSGIINHNKYASNYDYNMAVYMINRQIFKDTGYLLLREEKSLTSPVSVLHYEYYTSPSEPVNRIETLKDGIQCVVSSSAVPFGKSQEPELWDYADNYDTIDFLLKKNLPGIL